MGCRRIPLTIGDYIVDKHASLAHCFWPAHLQNTGSAMIDEKKPTFAHDSQTPKTINPFTRPIAPKSAKAQQSKADNVGNKSTQKPPPSSNK
jgi:hypothetical protein